MEKIFTERKKGYLGLALLFLFMFIVLYLEQVSKEFTMSGFVAILSMILSASFLFGYGASEQKYKIVGKKFKYVETTTIKNDKWVEVKE